MHLAPATAAAAALTIALAVGLCGTAAGQSAPAAWSPEFVQQVLADARDQGDARRGAGVFSAATTGCTSCHKVAGDGGAVGPELTTVARCLSPEEIVESLYWPSRAMKPEYRSYVFRLANGRMVQGIINQETADHLVVVEGTGKRHTLTPAEIDERTEAGSLMPANVFTSLPAPQRRDLVRYLLE
ncbi:MAG: hypothetical protein ACO37F_02295, partial [Pirellulales bacterium]